MKLKETVIAVFALALLGGLGLLWLAPAGLQQAPDITLTTLQGRKLSMRELRGRPVLVNFWATTCPGCVREMPHLVELYNELAPQGLEVIGIAMAHDPPSHVIALSEARQIPYPIALDINSDAAGAFGDVRLTPTSFLIAPDGRIVHQTIGELDMHEVRELLMDMLAQAQITENQVEEN
jgi:peroxiredoxin